MERPFARASLLSRLALIVAKKPGILLAGAECWRGPNEAPDFWIEASTLQTILA
jgi:hypothetical protein